MSIGIGKRPNLLDGVTDYGFTGDGSYVLFTTLWTSQSPSSGHLKGDYVAHSTDPNGKPVSVAFGAGDNIGMLIDRDQNTICFLKNGVRIDSAISCDLPPPQVELCVLAMLDCGGDSLVSYQLVHRTSIIIISATAESYIICTSLSPLSYFCVAVHADTSQSTTL